MLNPPLTGRPTRYASIWALALFWGTVAPLSIGVNIEYSVDATDPDPASQGWIGDETTSAGTDGDNDGFIDPPANHGPLNIGQANAAWQVSDQLDDGTLNRPRFYHTITDDELRELYENGWTFTFEFSANPATSNLSSGFIGWGFVNVQDVWPIAGGASRVGFWLTVENPGQSSESQTITVDTVSTPLPAGPAGTFHTVTVVGRPRSTSYEVFINGESKGSFDYSDWAVGGLTANQVTFGSGISGALSEVIDWKRVSLTSNAPVDVPPNVEALSTEFYSNENSIVGNGIDTATGSFTQSLDFLSLIGIFEFSFTGRYDSQMTHAIGPMGYGWTHHYDAWLEIFPDTGILEVHWDQNRVSRFEDIFFQQSDPYWEGIDDDVKHAVVQEIHDGYLAILDDQTQYLFNDDKQLYEIRNGADQRLVIHRDVSGKVIRINEPITNINLHLVYNSKGLISSVYDDLNRSASFFYDEKDRLNLFTAPTHSDADSVAASLPKAIPANGDPLNVELFFGQSEGVTGSVIFNFLEITHDSPEDLTLTLTSPSGTEVDVTSIAKINGDQLNITPGVSLGNSFSNDLRRGTWTFSVASKAGSPSGTFDTLDLALSESNRRTFLEYQDGDYPAAGRLTRVQDLREEQILRNEYDAIGRVVLQDDGRNDTPASALSYSEPDEDGCVVTTYTNRSGHQTVFTHDEGFRIKEVRNALGHTLSLFYDEDFNLIRRVDPRGNEITFEYDNFGQLINYTDEEGYTTTFTYNGIDRSVSTITDALGNVSDFAISSGSLFSAEHSENRVLSVEYHTDKQIKKIIRNEHSKVDYYLDPRGRIGTVGSPGSTGSSANGDGADKEYDLAGRIIITRDYEDRETTYEYSGSGESTRTTDPDGFEAIYDHDYRGRLIRTVGKLGNVTQYSYDGNGNMLTSTDDIGATTTYEYDFEDRIRRIIDPRGGQTTLTYDAIGQLIETTDAIGRTSRFEYDANGNIIRRFGPDGRLDVAFTYDKRGQIIAVEDGFGNRSTVEYDALERPVRTIDPRGFVREFGYDDMDRLATHSDSLNRRGVATYDNAQGGVPESVEILPYDYTQPPPQEVDGEEGLVLDYGYDYANNLTKLDGIQIQYEFDRNNQLLAIHVGEDLGIDFKYDSVGRVSETIGQNKNPAYVDEGRFRRYTYDPAGNLEEVRIPTNGIYNAATRRTYDSLGRLSTYIDENDEAQVYGYDLSSNLTSHVYPGGKIVQYEYDLANRLTKVTDWASRVTDIEWDDNDRITRIVLPNGVTRNMVYDDLGQLIMREDINAANQSILSYHYQYDPNGNIVSERQIPAEPNPISESVDYGYDSTWKRLGFNGGSVVRDKPGNVTYAPGLGELRYTARVRMERTDKYRYFYDNEDQLVGWQSRENEGRIANFTINPAGSLNQIISKSESDGSETIDTLYVYGIGLLYEEVEGELRVYHHDYRGSLVALSDASGNIIGRVSYDPYGAIASRTGDTDTIFLYNGLFGCPTSPENIVNMRFRWYSPTLRQFLQRDAFVGNISDLSTLNYFGFAGGNPINRVDPEGELWWIAVGAVVGAAVNTTIVLIEDIADDGQLNTEAERYGAAAIGGAVSGAIIAGTGGVGGAIIGGAAGAATENLVYAGLTGQKVDPVELAIETTIGGASGALGQGAGKAFSRSTKLARRKAVRSLSQLVKRSARKTGKQVLTKIVVGTIGSQADNAFNDAINTRSSSLNPGGTGSIGRTGTGKGLGAIDVWIRHARGGRPDKENIQGAYRNFSLYLEAHEIAGERIIASPNYNLFNF